MSHTTIMSVEKVGDKIKILDDCESIESPYIQVIKKTNGYIVNVCNSSDEIIDVLDIDTEDMYREF